MALCSLRSWRCYALFGALAGALVGMMGVGNRLKTAAIEVLALGDIGELGFVRFPVGVSIGNAAMQSHGEILGLPSLDCRLFDLVQFRELNDGFHHTARRDDGVVAAFDRVAPIGENVDFRSPVIGGDTATHLVGRSAS